MAIPPDSFPFDADAPLTVGQAQRLVINVLQSYGAAMVQRTPGLARPYVQKVVDDLRGDLPDLVHQCLVDVFRK